MGFLSEGPDQVPLKRLESYPGRGGGSDRGALGGRQPGSRRSAGGIWPFVISAAAGALAAFAVSAIVDWAAAESDRECANATGLCWGTAPYVGLAGGFCLVLALCWIGFALAGLRPLIGYVLGGILLFVVMTMFFLTEIHGGRLHPGTGYAGLMAAAFLIFPANDRFRSPRA